MADSIFETSRRQFMKLAAAAATPLGALPAAADTAKRHAPAKEAIEPIEYPRRFSGEHLARIAFPLGGIGTGGMELGGRGNLRSWQIFNRSADQEMQPYIFPAIFVRPAGRPEFASFLERELLPPFDIHDNGVRLFGLPGMPRMKEAEFHGSFPLARIHFQDAR